MNKANAVYTRLSKEFGDAKCALAFNSMYELIVAVILSARCTDIRVNEITPILFKKYPTADSLSKAKEKDVEKIIYSCGFYKNKSKSIISMAKDVCLKFNGKVPSRYEDLISLRGVGRKTANVVLAVGFKKPAIAVDTHVFRVANRLGLVKAKTPLECELGLQKEINKSKWAKFHQLLILEGRYVCKARNPMCEKCVLKDLCTFYKRLPNK